MAWTISLSPKAERQLAKLDRQVAKRIRSTLTERIAAQPDPRVLGTKLVAAPEGLWRFRIGDYRVICEMRENELLILALAIGHRKDIYQ